MKGEQLNLEVRSIAHFMAKELLVQENGVAMFLASGNTLDFEMRVNCVQRVV